MESSAIEPKNIPEAFPTPDTSKPDTKIEHTVYLDSVGGVRVLSSESLNFKNIEMIYSDITSENIKKSILHFRPHLNVKGITINVIDNRQYQHVFIVFTRELTIAKTF